MARLLIFGAIGGVLGWILMGALAPYIGGGGTMLLSLALLGVVGVVVARNLATNRKVLDASPEARAEALAFTAPAGKAALYVLRNQFVGMAVGVNVMVDGREVAQLKSPRFTRILMSPGAHRLSGYVATNKKPADGEGLPLQANAGEIIVMKCEIEPQMIGAIVKFTPLAPDHVRAAFAKTRMVQADVAEV